uniref:Uncharacterized protein n=1 Tax=Rhizophora mucronata TaxID=61149 RepID=A0A2P2NZ98_RHIMU
MQLLLLFVLQCQLWLLIVTTDS